MGILDDYLDPDRHLYNNEEPDHVSDAWEAINAYFGQEEGDRNEKVIKKQIYKHTDCGAWIEFEENGIRLGSIVEGSDSGCASYFIPWRRVTEATISERIEAVEKEATAIWDWANEEREDGKTDAETGLDFPDVATDYEHLHRFDGELK